MSRENHPVAALTIEASVASLPRAAPPRTSPATRSQERAAGSVSVPAWINILSLDAVAVALIWQVLFTWTFLQRWPSWHEGAILALAVWLIYVGDHLLDARRLGRSRPHLLRHRMHADHTGAFAAAWGVGCIAAVVVAWRWLEPDLVRVGLVVTGLVVAYAVSVHAGNRISRRGAKELAVGLLFAGGVSAVCWKEAPGASLLAGTLLAGLLFAANCRMVTLRESRVQPAVPGGCGVGCLRLLLGAVLLCAVLGALSGGLPVVFAAGVFAGGLGLLGLERGLRSGGNPLRPLRPDAPTLVDPRGLLVDAALLVPPACAAVAVAWWLSAAAAA